MAAQQNFRTAFNGFHKEDVVHYIEYLNARHTAEVNQLKSELDFLRTRLDGQPDGEEPQVDPVIEQQAARIRELFDRNRELEQQLAEAVAAREEAESRLGQAVTMGSEMENQLNDTMAAKTRLAADLESAIQQQSSYRSRMEEELEAYRRAERTERLARERTEQMYRQANGTIADATVKVDEAAVQISQLTDRVSLQLAELQSAISGSKQALRDAAATMYTIRPNIDSK